MEGSKPRLAGALSDSRTDSITQTSASCSFRLAIIKNLAALTNLGYNVPSANDCRSGGIWRSRTSHGNVEAGMDPLVRHRIVGRPDPGE
jgi:hypothetical protein